MLKICAVACPVADPGIWIWFRIRGVDDQTKIWRKNNYIDIKYKVKKRCLEKQRWMHKAQKMINTAGTINQW